MKSKAIHTLYKLSLALLLLISSSLSINAQTETADNPQAQTETKKSQETIDTLNNLLQERKQQRAQIKVLKSELLTAKEDVTKAELEQKTKEATDKLANLESQIATLTSGTTKQEFYAKENKEFDLQKELQGLAEPFIKMIKSSTQTAREIDHLQSTINEAKRRQTIAKTAQTRISHLMTTLKQTNNPSAKPTQGHLKEQEKQWQERLKEALQLEETSTKQFQLKKEQISSLNLENYATSFIQTRGKNILIALFTFIATFTVLRLLSKIISMLYAKSGIKKSIYTRLTKLIFEFATILISIIATMAVLNYLNDWILFGLAGLFTLALAWGALKVLPVFIEQTILMLNLGAVQEGERLLIDGVPWQVKKLDHYTEFENPVLDGGQFTLPIRKLIGLHSRPAAHNEAWFPTHKDDWVQLENGYIAKVESQTPELVQLIELGGARLTYATQEFLNASFRNLSTGFRIRQTFGIAYSHQKEATQKIPSLLTEHIKNGLEKYLNPDDINHIEVDLLSAANSSIDYDIEVDIKGSQAHRFEDIEGEITRLLIEASNLYELEIPFPQMVIHQPN